ncbi:hypothetical protein [Clostridium tyrobutyricum]|uniref:hypothetical protein n=1 Tax=Clostridium tyrobutyricum TaxID=1519 RepID=UPI0010AAC706|nr:hypothetical protein [Clostridium tyrobutyricum]QCH27776.1 hypothetical protein EZN00_01374 [Clostridium tyrobutyricum]
MRKFRNDYFTIDRRGIKIGFDELLSKHKKERTIHLHMNKCINTNTRQLPLDIQSENKTEIKSKNGLQRNKPVIYICNKLKICPICHKPMEGELYLVNIMSKGVILRKKLTTLKCSSCRKYFLDESVFKSFTQNKKLQDINVKFRRFYPQNMVLPDQNWLNTEKVVKQIYLTSCLGCKKCDSELAIKGCKIALYKNLSVDNQIEKLVNDELFYCKKCDMYYATNILHGKLLQKYEKNKLNFQNI